MAFTHPTAQKLLSTGPSQVAITPPPAYGSSLHDPTLDCTITDFEDSSLLSPSPSTNNDDEELSPIHLKIHTPLIIDGDNNLVAIDPAISASKIAMAAVEALKQMSMGASGVPMIDEEGRPRPLKVEVLAEVKVEGSRNVVGERAVLAVVAGRRKSDGVASETSVTSGAYIGAKRTRMDGDDIDDEEGGKRVRME